MKIVLLTGWRGFKAGAELSVSADDAHLLISQKKAAVAVRRSPRDKQITSFVAKG